MNWKTLKYIHIPAVATAFLCLLLYFHHNESVRIAELSKAMAAADASTAVEGENLEDFHATAYCITGVTKSGVPVAPGHVAADPKIIPLGSLIYVESVLKCGYYQVTDTGRLIRGKIIDIFIPSHGESIEFGRRKVKVKVLRYGYENSENITPAFQ